MPKSFIYLKWIILWIDVSKPKKLVQIVCKEAFPIICFGQFIFCLVIWYIFQFTTDQSVRWICYLPIPSMNKEISTLKFPVWTELYQVWWVWLLYCAFQHYLPVLWRRLLFQRWVDAIYNYIWLRVTTIFESEFKWSKLMISFIIIYW